MGSQNSNRPYDQIETPDPDEKPKSEWSVNERRAWILNQMDTGWFDDLDRSAIAEDFGISPQMVYKDIKVLKEWYAKNIGEDTTIEVIGVVESSLKKAHADDDYRDVAYIADKLHKILADTGFVETEPDRVEQKIESEGSVDIVLSSYDDEEEEEGGEDE